MHVLDDLNHRCVQGSGKFRAGLCDMQIGHSIVYFPGENTVEKIMGKKLLTCKVHQNDEEVVKDWIRIALKLTGCLLCCVVVGHSFVCLVVEREADKSTHVGNKPSVADNRLNSTVQTWRVEKPPKQHHFIGY